MPRPLPPADVTPADLDTLDTLDRERVRRALSNSTPCECCGGVDEASALLTGNRIVVARSGETLHNQEGDQIGTAEIVRDVPCILSGRTLPDPSRQPSKLWEKLVATVGACAPADLRGAPADWMEQVAIEWMERPFAISRDSISREIEEREGDWL